jgi:hypothetical protein
VGTGRGVVKLMLDECAERKFKGTVLQLGRRDLYSPKSQLEKLSVSRVSFSTKPWKPATTQQKPFTIIIDFSFNSFYNKMQFSLTRLIS